MEDQLILVDESDKQNGTAGKTEVHRKGILHRAVSVFIFNNKEEFLLQRRALSKYHSAGLWSNTCCGHPLPGESTLSAAMRRLKFEMGMETKLNFKDKFHYKVNLDNGLIENELDHVFFGITDDTPLINPDEVAEWKYISPEDLTNQLKNFPERFTPWLKICIDRNILEGL